MWDSSISLHNGTYTHCWEAVSFKWAGHPSSNGRLTQQRQAPRAIFYTSGHRPRGALFLGHQCHHHHQSGSPVSPVRASCKKHEVGQCLGSRHFGNWAKKGRRFWSVRAEDGWKTVQLLPKRCYSKTIQSLFKSIIL